MSDCRVCGRDDGHYIGCEAINPPPRPTRRYEEPDPGFFCEHHGCPEAKREWSGKGAKPKFCQKHSDPKNRK